MCCMTKVSIFNCILSGINSAADLANQHFLDYGTVEGSQTETFFNHTRMTDYAKMWAYMSTLSPGSIVRRVEDGFEVCFTLIYSQVTSCLLNSIEMLVI